MEKLQPAVLRTLAYADIFDYPLTFEELYRFLVCPPSSRTSFGILRFKEMLKQVQHDKTTQIDTDGNFYFLKGREKIVALRKKRERWSREKLKIAQKVAGWLRLIPWVRLVGVTGSLAIGNSSEADDIDILIVSRKGRLWLTRMMVTILVEILGIRRRPEKNRDKSRYSFFLPSIHPRCKLGNLEVRNKICLNMFLDEAHLSVPEKERDLFSAHEVCQLKILWDKEGSGQNFFWENRWVKKYLPNSLNITLNTKNLTQEKKVFSIQYLVFSYLENIVKRFQLWYMEKRRTTEVISEGIIRFHPQDARGWVLREYGLRLQKLGLDKI